MCWRLCTDVANNRPSPNIVTLKYAEPRALTKKTNSSALAGDTSNVNSVGTPCVIDCCPRNGQSCAKDVIVTLLSTQPSAVGWICDVTNSKSPAPYVDPMLRTNRRGMAPQNTVSGSELPALVITAPTKRQALKTTNNAASQAVLPDYCAPMGIFCC